MSPAFKNLVLLAASGCALLLGCATTRADGQPNYAQEAAENLARGKQAFESKNYVEARQYFEYVRAKYPYLEQAKEAELRLADTMFAQEEYIEARDAYENFIKLHPTWPEVDYAAYKAALTHYKAIPSDFFLLPPPEEKDQSEVQSAQRALDDFLRQYPDSKLRPEAEAVLLDVRRRLAKHEVYVAEFYARRERWNAVAQRLETVANEYKGIGFDEKALFGLYDAYTRLKQPDKARKALEEVVARMPGTPAAKRATSLLGKS